VAGVYAKGYRSSEFSGYLIRQLSVPATRIEQVCGHIRYLDVGE